MPQSDDDNNGAGGSSDQTTLALKRHITALQEENSNLKGATEKKSQLSGRVVRRLVTLTARVEDLICESDRRVALNEANEGENVDEHSKSEERAYRSYRQLVRWYPSIERIVGSQSDPYQLRMVYTHIMHGADGARGDDAANLKVAVAAWLMEDGNTNLRLKDKSGRGFYNDTTGKLLCPVDYNWHDERIKRNIRAYHPDYIVTAYSWPAFLYTDCKYDSKNPAKGLFKGQLLVRAFKYIFTSPSSAEEPAGNNEDEGQDQPQAPLRKRRKTSNSGERRTRSCVASLLGMTSVQPRAIAYIAVQLRFALSNCCSWRAVDEDFDHDEFYNNIVDHFERPASAGARQVVSDLLFWWNREVFGRANVLSYRPQAIEKLSVAMSSADSRVPSPDPV
ncbi:hypothetical protein BJ138DRAFT_1107442 [Hygrophoropsis aurantiaca]|uniref:Uncharacterized protein n=1 Tax=Hygrophoropsis aurantiaca TaxID=72124 RepID=A0ACB7ZRB9_9AGAM|nr:hypothetical protein BJ138DRAFT_1107442 [Hygrophoropsis aurantiaca]